MDGRATTRRCGGERPVGVAPWAGRAGRRSPPPGVGSSVRGVRGRAGRARTAAGGEREESGRDAEGPREESGTGRATRALVQEQGCRSDPGKGRFAGRVGREAFGKDARRPEGLEGS